MLRPVGWIKLRSLLGENLSLNMITRDCADARLTPLRALAYRILRTSMASAFLFWPQTSPGINGCCNTSSHHGGRCTASTAWVECPGEPEISAIQDASV